LAIVYPYLSLTKLNKLKIIIGIGTTALIVIAVISATHQTNLTTEKMKLIKGEETVNAAHNKYAVDDENCKEFNLPYGPRG
jgi:hypothetical protein